MKRVVLVLGLSLLLCGTAEAGIGDWLKNSWSYVTTPVSCVVELGKDLLVVGTKFVVCVLGNVNRNPLTLSGPLVTVPSSNP